MAVPEKRLRSWPDPSFSNSAGHEAKKQLSCEDWMFSDGGGSENSAGTEAAPLRVGTREGEGGECGSGGGGLSATGLGLEQSVVTAYGSVRGVRALYAWQRECLETAGTGNLLISLPTSGGKTLVAELLMLRALCGAPAKDALLVLPFVSLVQEKVGALVPLGLRLGFLVEEYAGTKGRLPPIRRRRKPSLYLATIEKANSLLNALAAEGRAASLGVVVLDEVHMVGDGAGGRGWQLEALAVKLAAASPATRLVAMSATVGNLKELASALKARLFTSTFRPITLQEKALFDGGLYRLHSGTPDLVRWERSVRSGGKGSDDPDGLVGLVAEVVPAASCLVFCSTKQGCENVVGQLAGRLPKTLKEVRVREKKRLLGGLESETGGRVCPVLRRSVPYGLAYHHSGLSAEERRLLQDAFLAGTLSAIVATSTLAAGVNLPARRVIIRSPRMGRRLLSFAEYSQMAGRAGRAGLDSQGESILILSDPRDRQAFLALAAKGMPHCESSLAADDLKGIQALVVSLLTLRLAKTAAEIVSLIRAHSLLGLQEARLKLDVDELVGRVLERLKAQGLTEVGAEGGWEISTLGKGSVAGGLGAGVVERVVVDLERRLREGLVLGSELHLLTVCVPYEGLEESVRIDWRLFYELFLRLDGAERAGLALEGVDEPGLLRRLGSCGGSGEGSFVVEPGVRRAYVGLMLRQLWSGKSAWAVGAEWGVGRGAAQSLLQSAASFASALCRFCAEVPRFWAIGRLLEGFPQRLRHCAAAELGPLMELHGVREARARQLLSLGLKSVAAVARADPEDLADRLPHLSKAQAQRLVAQAQMLQKEALAAQLEQVEALLDSDNLSSQNVIDALTDVAS